MRAPARPLRLCIGVSARVLLLVSGAIFVGTGSGLLSAYGQQRATLEPDHVYLWVSPSAPEQARLLQLGINKYPTVTDNGEGVAQETFVFENTILELLWVSDDDLFRGSWVASDPLHAERANWRATGASPFGLAFHRKDSTMLELPFATKDGWYEELGGYVQHSDALAPALFVMAPRTSMPEPSWMTEQVRNLRQNRAGIRRLTSVTLGTPRPLRVDAVAVLEQQGALHLKRTNEHLLELTFDHYRQQRTFDGRPDLPLVIRY